MRSRALTVVLIAGFLAVYAGVVLALQKWLEVAPLTFLAVLVGLLLVGLPIYSFFSNRLAGKSWKWDQFASRFKGDDPRAAGDLIASGLGAVGGNYFYLDTTANRRGIVVESILYEQRPTASIPWDDISRLDRMTIDHIGRRRCKPYHCVQLYLKRKGLDPPIFPWDESFDHYIPNSVGINRLGRGTL